MIWVSIYPYKIMYSMLKIWYEVQITSFATDDFGLED